MPYVRSPFYTGEQKRDPGEAIAGALGTIFGGPDPETLMKAGLMGAQTRQANAKAGLDEDELYARQTGIGQLFAGDGFADESGNIADPGALIAMGIRAGLEDPGKSLFRPYLAVTGDGEQMRRGLVSAGQMPTVNTALSMGESDQISARDARESMSEALAKQSLANAGAMERLNAAPRTLNERLGDAFMDLPPEEQMLAARMESLGGVTPRNVVLPDGTQTIAIGNTYRNAEGGYDELPLGAQVFTAQSQGEGPAGALGLTNAVTTDVQKGLLALNRVEDTIGRIEEIAQQNPTAFGTIGNARGAAQDVYQQGATLLDSVLGTSLSDTRQRVAETGSINPAYFDPDLPQLQLLANSLAYDYATAIAGNDRISDSDFRQAQIAVGDPAEWLGSREKTQAKMQELRRMVGNRRATASSALQGGLGGSAPPPASGPVILDVADPDSHYDSLPPGTLYVGPDGIERTKQ